MGFISPQGTKYHRAIRERTLKGCTVVPDLVKPGQIAGTWMVFLISMCS